MQNLPTYAIETNNLSVHYGGFTAVRDVNIKIEKQRITAIIGLSGCGKSTLLRASDYTAMMIDDARAGGVIEFDDTKKIFACPGDKRTEDYVTGRFG